MNDKKDKLRKMVLEFVKTANFIKVIPDALSLNKLSSMEKYLRNKFNADSIQMQIDGVY